VNGTVYNESNPIGTEVLTSANGCDSTVTINLDYSCVFDLALIKQLSGGQATTVNPGDNVNYTITVFNQGNVPAYNIEVTDYLPSDMVFNAGDNANWTNNSGLLTANIAGPIAAGSSAQVTLILQVSPSFAGSIINNYAEISDADDDLVTNNAGPYDVDSSPDQDDANDTDGGDDVTDNSNGDEDDQDGALVNVATLSLGNLVWEDLNNDGIFDAGTESGISGVQVQLYDLGTDGIKSGDDNLLDTEMTDGNGEYLFDGLNEGTYYVKLTGVGVPAGYVSSTGDGIYDTDGNGSFEPFFGTNGDVNNTDDGTAMGAMIMSDTIALTLFGEPTNDGDASNNTNLTVDFGLYQADTFDLALRKTLAIGQSPYVQPGNVVTYTITVFNQGTVSAFGIQINDYVPAGMTFDNGLNPAWVILGGNPWTIINTELLAGDSIKVDIKLTVDAGQTSGNLSNYAEINAADDDTNGGNTPPVDIDSTPNNISNDDGGVVNNEIDNNEGDEDDHDVELIYLVTQSLGNLVWEDLNNDGIFDAGTESGISGVEVQLYDLGTDGIKSGDDNLLDTEMTDGNGEYLFDGLNEGTYYVKLTGVGVPAGYVSSTGDGIYDTDGNGSFEPFFGTNGDVNNTDDGTAMGAMIMSDTIVLTIFGEPTDDGDASNNTNLTVDFGLYQADTFDVALIKQLSGGQATTVNPGDNVSYTITVYNQGTVPAYDVEVTDYLPSDMVFNAGDNANWTNNGGLLTTTVAGPIAAGSSAQVTLVLQVSPSFAGALIDNSAEISIADDDTDDMNGTPTDLDSDPNQDDSDDTDGGDDVTDNSNGDEDDEDNTLINVATLSLGNLVWEDLDNDGIFDAGTESGISGVEVQLYDLGTDGIKSGDDNLLDTEMTDGNGEYLFDGLNAGTYYVKLTGVGVPAGYVSSTGDGIYDTDGNGSFEPFFGTNGDVNNTDDGTAMGAMIMSDTIVLTIFGEPTNDGDADNNTNLTVDFGLYQADTFDVALIKQLSGGQATTVNPGDNVSYTITVYNQGTVPAYNIEVTDYLPSDMVFNAGDNANWTNNGGLLTTTVAGPIAAGSSAQVTLVLQVSPSFSGAVIDNSAEVSIADDDTDDMNGTPTDLDSDPDQDDENDTDGGDDVTDNSNGDEDDEDNAVINVATLSLGNLVWEDLDNDGIFDAGTESGISGVEVQLYDLGTDGIKSGDDNLLGTEMTDGNGEYLFDGLNAGTYYVKLTGVGVPAGYVSSTGDGIYDTDGNGSFEPFFGTNGDVNNTDDGTAMGAMIMSDTIVLTIFGEPTNDGDASNNTNLTVDFGLYQADTFDVALIKQLSGGQATTVNPGDNVSYTITVYNQGTVPAYNIEVTDYLPSDMVFNAGDNANWTNNGGLLTTTVSGPIAAGSSAQVTLVLQVSPSFSGAVIDNSAEISIADDDTDDMNGTPTDLDSDPDQDDENDTNGGDDVTDNSNGDEDDEDNALINIATLSLGNLVWEDLNNDGIFDAGTESGISGVEVQLYDLGTDGIKSSDDNLLDTEMTDGNGEYLFDGLNEGTYYVKLTGVGVPAGYVSSTGDGIYDTDGNGSFEPFFGTNGDVNNTDDGTAMGAMIMSDTIVLTIFGEPTNDGDADNNTNLTVDFGLYQADTFDLALIKQLSGGQATTVNPGDNVSYTITVYNQGTVPAYEVEVTDYLPTDMVFNAGDNANWTNNGGLLTTTVAGPIAAGSSAQVTLVLQVSPSYGGALIDNSAEISIADDDTDDMNGTPTDLDSDPDQDDENDTNGGDDVTDNSNGDEDDEDNTLINVATLSLGNLVWEDLDNDGIFDAGTESGISGVEVQLYDLGTDGIKSGDDNLLDTEMTDGNGEYLFDGLNAGTYYVKLTGVGVPAGYVSSTGDGIYDTDGNGSFEPFFGTNGDVNNTDDGTAMGAMIMSDTIVLTIFGEPTNDGDASNNTNLTVDFGLYQADTFDVALIKQLSGGQATTVNPGDNVSYTITVYNQGTVPAYEVEVTDYLPTDMVFNAGDNANWTNNGGLLTTTVAGPIAAGSSAQVTLVLQVSPSFSGAVIDNSAEVSIADDDTDDMNGTPTDLDSDPNQDDSDDTDGGDDVTDNSNGDEDDEDNAVINVATLSLGNLVWEDLNNDGIFDAGTESGISGVEVQLYDLGTDGIKSGDDNLLDTEMTDGNGEYLFDGLNAGTYYVKLTGVGVPAGYVSSTGDGIYDTDGNGSFEPFFGTNGDVNNTDDGTAMGAMIMSDTIVLTIFGEPTNDGDADNNTNLTVDFGLYQADTFDVALIKQLSGGQATTVNPGDNVSYTITVYNQGTVPAYEVEVTDYLPSDMVFNAGDNSNWTNNGGLLTTTVAGPIAAGSSAQVTLVLQVSPSYGGALIDNSAEISVADDDTDDMNGTPTDLDSDPDQDDENDTNGGDDVTDNSNGDEDDEDNAVINVATLSLGNLVWEDLDNDGIFDAGTESGISGVEVQLYDLGTDGIKSGDDNLLDTEMTDGNGEYLFDGLNEGTYYVKLTGVGVPAGYVSSTGDGIYDTDGDGSFEPFFGTNGDVNNTDDGTAMGAMIMSDTIVLTIFGEPTNDGDASNNTNLTVDFGLYQADTFDVALIKQLSGGQATTVNPGDNVSYTITVYNQGTVPAYEVEVTDYLPTDMVFNAGDNANWTNNGGLLTTTVAGPIAAGSSAQVTLVLQVSPSYGGALIDNSAEISIADDDTDDMNGTPTDLDSDPDQDDENDTNGGDDVTDNSNGDEDDEDNAVINVATLSLGNLVWEDLDNDGIFDAGTESGISGVEVQLYDLGTDGIKSGDDNLLDTEMTDGNGEYLFDGLNAGTYYVKLTGVGVPAGYVSSTGDGIYDTDGDGSFEPFFGTNGDVNNTDDGTAMGAMIMSDTIVLTIFGEPTNDGDASNNTNLTVDFGLYQADIFDLALRKTLAIDQIVQVEAGDTVTYTITVFNQGTVSAYGIQLNDYVPAGMTFDAGINPGWIMLGGNPWTILNNELQPGDSVKVDIKLIIEATQTDGNLENYAEINTADDDTNSGNNPPVDTDSTPNNIPGDDGTLVDNEINNNGGDEDDHDIAVIEVLNILFVDLELDKSLAPGQSNMVNIGDEIHYFIKVTNTGMDPGYNVVVEDNIPVGMTLSPNSTGWTSVNSSLATYLLADPIYPGESDSVEIILIVGYGASGASLINLAEIVSATDINGMDLDDIDSDPDNNDPDEDDQDLEPIELMPHDPTGYIYCDKTGKVIMGGTINVTGPGAVTIVSDGLNGYYEFYTDGTPGVYTLSYNHPVGYPLSTTCLPQAGPFDPTGLPNPVVLGSGITGGSLTDFNCANNDYYLTFVLEPGDPVVFNNNIPVKCVFIGSLVCEDTNGNNIADPGEPTLDGVTVNLYNCSDTLNPIMTTITSDGGHYRFDGLPEGDYMVQFELLPGYYYVQANQGGNDLMDSDADAYGYSHCITLEYGECDTTVSACFVQCYVDNLAVSYLKPSDCGVDDGSIFIMADASFGVTLMYSIDGGQTYYPTNEFTGLAAGMYEVVVRGDGLNNCTASETVTLAAPTGPTILGITPVDPGCYAADGSIEIEAAGANGIIYSIDDGNSWQSSELFTGLSGGDYDIAVANADTTCIVYANISLNIPVQPILLDTIEDVEVCISETIPVSVTMNQNISTYSIIGGNYSNAVSSGGNLVFDAEFGNSNSVTFEVTLVNADGCFVTDEFTISVADVPIAAISTSVIDICNGTYAVDFVGTSSASAILTWSLDGGQILSGSPAGGANNPADAHLIVQWATAGVKDITLNIVDDLCMSSASTTVNVATDTEVPVFTFVPADITINCGTNIPVGVPTATDNCIDVTISLNEMTMPGTCSQEYTLIRKWTATDGAGNTAMATQSISVVDNIPPVITFINPDLIGIQDGDTLYYDCINGPNLNMSDVSISDNCDVTPTGMFIESQPTVGNCEEDGYLYHLICGWKATDDCGNSTQINVVILILDDNAPVLGVIPADITISCGDVVPPAANVTATDICDSEVTVTSSMSTAEGGCTDYIYRTWTATDDCGNTDVATQTITITDNAAPYFTFVPANVTVECTQIPAVGTPLAEDACDLNVTISYIGEQLQAQSCGYLLVRQWSATDDCGNSKLATQVITVTDDTAPVITGVPGDVTVECNQIPSQGMPTVTDNCDQTPALTFNQTTSQIGCTQLFVRTWTATDDCGNSTTSVQTITVTDYTPPVLAGIPADITIECDEPLPAPATPTATDNCDQNVTISYNQAVQTIGCTNIYTRTWTATDDCGNSSVRAQIITSTDTEAPVITFVNPLLIGVENGDTLYFDCINGPNLGVNDITISDNCDDNPVGMFLEGAITEGDCAEDGYLLNMHCGWKATDNCGNSTQIWIVVRIIDTTPPVISNAPADITLDCSDLLPPVILLSATDLCDLNVEVGYNQTTQENGCTDLVIRTWTATDDCGNTDVVTQTITVTDNFAPFFTYVPANVTVECDELPAVGTPEASDNCDNSVTINYLGQTQQDQDCGYILVRRWSATDDCGNSKLATQVITVTDETAPVIAGVPSDVTVECDEVPAPAQPTVTDNCDLTPTLTYNQTAGPQNACTQVIYRTWTATDDCDNSTARTQTITITDYTAPVLAGIPADITIQCDEPLPAPATPTATDNCDQNVTISYNQVVQTIGCTNIYTRTWTATDDCGNSTVKAQTITTIDTEAPVITFVNPLLIGVENGDTLYFDCVYGPNLGINDITISDNCDDNPVGMFLEGTITEGDCAEDGYLLNMHCGWKATDNCGNSTQIWIVVRIIDTIPPVISAAPADITLDCSDLLPAAAVLTATDLCDLNVEVGYNQTTQENGCIDLVIRTWTATDDCGNTDVATQTISITDTYAPFFTYVPANVTVECDEIPAVGTPIADDNCDDSVTIAYLGQTQQAQGCGSIIVRRWSATDDCGNSKMATQIITVTDETPPVITGVPADVTVECTAVPAPAQPTATDNCDLTPTLTYNQTAGPQNACTQVIYRTWTATDDCGNSTARTQTITVTDYTAPVLAGIPADITIQCDEPLPAPATPTATDNCDQNVTISYNQTVQTIGCTNIYTRTWTATDDCGNSTARSQTITTIDTEAPVITFINPALIGAENGDTLYFDCVYGPNLGINDITITDNCDDNPTGTFLEGTITQGDCIEDGYIVEMHCGWSATDNCGNSTQLWVVIRVTDSIPPVISAPPADITLHCYETIPPVATLTATDLCDDNVTVTFNQTSPTSGCTPTLIRTWTATDDCGNTDVATQTIIFIDDSAPVLVGVPANITVECNEVPPPAVVTATDDCDQNVTVTFTETQQAQPCGYLLVRRWTATDDCGNAKTGTQVITVTDETAPVIAGVPADVTVECTAVPAPGPTDGN
jgi:uncharacterized repeat protein (TIGR01451 family)